MCVRGDAVRGSKHDHPRGVPQRVEPELLQRPRKERRVLEAIAAPSRTDELVLQTFDVQANRPAQQNIKILERDGAHVRLQQPAQGVQILPNRAAPLDASQVGVEVERSVIWLAVLR